MNTRRSTNFRERREAGITLVALVVTIIVLLILAGIAISLVLGNNGVLNRAQYASNSWSNATKDEETAMAGFASDVDTLTAGYIEREGGSGGGSGGSGGGGSSSSLVIKDNTGTPIDLANIANYYGHDVTYNGKTFQLFLVDTTGKYSNGEARIWLQHKDYVALSSSLDSNLETTGILSDSASSKLWEVNPDLATKYKTTIRGIAESSLNANIKAVAYLCNTSNWNSTYVASADITAGAYAIGGVSAEMFCDSYNQARGVTSGASLFDAKAFNKNSTYGYWYKPNGQTNSQYYEGDYGSYTDYNNYALPSSDYGKMYRPLGSCCTWLASPSAYGAYRVCDVSGNGGYLSDGSDASSARRVRAAVSLPSDIQIQLTN